MGELIQFRPRSKPDMSFEQEAKFYEHLLGYPAGSYRGSYSGVPHFEVADIESIKPENDPA